MSKGLIIAAVALVGLAAWRWQDPGPPPPIAWDAPMVKALTADLSDARGQPAPPHTLANAQRILLYASASWCPACQEFTPQLVDFYHQHGGGKKFQLLFLSCDEDAGAMRGYMRGYDMPWWGVRYHSASSKLLGTAYPGDTIPHLVLLDGQGRVLANGSVDGRYLGPDAVLAALAAER
jgi:thiol-disulfide isomerase/thioredoxin